MPDAGSIKYQNYWSGISRLEICTNTTDAKLGCSPIIRRFAGEEK